MSSKLALWLIGFFSLFIANAYSITTPELEIKGEISLSGNDIPFETNSSDGNDHRSITPDIPIFVTLFENNAIEVEFIAAVGDVEITISQNGIPVYSASETVADYALKNIQLPSGSQGTFLIEIKGGNGAYAYGSFEL